MKTKDLLIRVDELLEMGNRALSTRGQTEFNDEYIDPSTIKEFRTAVLSFIDRVYGKEHPHFNEFQNSTTGYSPNAVEEGIGILNAIHSEIEGNWLFDLKSLVTAEVFADFIEMAEHLLETGYKDPAAVMCGSVLEEHLRQLCSRNEITVDIEKNNKHIPKKADLLNSELTKKGVYSKLDQKMVTAWLDLRNKSAHGEYNEYTEEQVKNMLVAVTEFMSRVGV